MVDEAGTVYLCDGIASPFPDEAMPLAYTWLQEAPWSFTGDDMPKSLLAFLSWWQAGRESGIRDLALCDPDGRVAGVMWMRPTEPGVAEISLLFSRDLPRKVELAALVRSAFQTALSEEFGLRRLFALVCIWNTSVIGLLKAAGATREGVLREHLSRGQKPQNVVVLGVLRGDLQ